MVKEVFSQTAYLSLPISIDTGWLLTRTWGCQWCDCLLLLLLFFFYYHYYYYYYH